MVNINMEFRHPKYYKELRKRNKSDQAISGANSTEEKTSRATGPGLQQVIEETVPHNDIEEATSSKHQAASKPEPSSGSQASSGKLQSRKHKHQAPSHKLQAQ